MAINLKNTNDVHVNGVKMLCHGQSGAGKTYLIRTLPNPIIISAESGLLSLHDTTIPYIDVSSLEDVQEVYNWILGSEEASQYESIALDSISEIAEVVLSKEKARSKDGRAAYGEANDKMSSIIRSFRDIVGKNVYFSAKTEYLEGADKKLYYGPSMPGKSLTVSMPYFFDIVLAIRMGEQEGKMYRMLQCENDDMWMAKNRGGFLEKWEVPDLGEVIRKIKGE